MRRNELIMNLFFLCGFSFIVILVVPIISYFLNAPLNSVLIISFFLLVGFLMFFKAKLSLIAKGKLISFGSSNMSEANRIYYILGYVLMGIGLLLSLLYIGISHA